MQEPGRETESPSVTAVWGQLPNQHDKSNIQQRLGDTLKRLALETETRESQAHFKARDRITMSCVCVSHWHVFPPTDYSSTHQILK